MIILKCLWLLVNGKIESFAIKEYKSFEISKHSQIEVMDWKFYVKPAQQIKVIIIILFIAIIW